MLVVGQTLLRNSSEREKEKRKKEKKIYIYICGVDGAALSFTSNLTIFFCPSELGNIPQWFVNITGNHDNQVCVRAHLTGHSRCSGVLWSCW